MKPLLRLSVSSLIATSVAVSSLGTANAVPASAIHHSVAEGGDYLSDNLLDSIQLSKNPVERRDQLMASGFTKVANRIDNGYTIETYSKHDISGITVEFDVVLPPTGPAPYVNFEWDWGPRVYMTGEEFWSLGAAGFAGAICDFVSGGLAAAGCSIATSALWNKIAGNNSILTDQTCYDFSQALNIGWEVAPAEKCS